MIVSPNLYSLSFSLANDEDDEDDEDDDDDEGNNLEVVSSLRNGFIISVVDVTSAVVKDERLSLGGSIFDVILPFVVLLILVRLVPEM